MYLAELANPDNPKTAWVDDPEKIGRIKVVYKRNVRWARPCMPFGSFHFPDVEWVRRNWKKYRVWVDFEHQKVTAQREDSMIYLGFIPVGGEQHPQAGSNNDKPYDEYPKVEIIEKGNWRFVITKNRLAGASPEDADQRLELFKITSAPGAAVTETLLVLAIDGSSTVNAADKTFTAYLPYGSTSMTFSMDASTEGEEQISLVHGLGMAINMVAGLKNSVVIRNKNGDGYVEVNDDGVTVNGDTLIQGSLCAGGATATELAHAAAVSTIVGEIVRIFALLAPDPSAAKAAMVTSTTTGGAIFTALATLPATMAKSV